MKTAHLLQGISLASTYSLISLWFLAFALFAPGRAAGQNTYADPYAFSTLAGNAGYGSSDGTGSAARFHYPGSVAVDGTGNLYVADSGNHTIRKMTPAGVVTTLAGLAGISGSVDGTGNAARFNNPQGVAVDGSGNVYVADANNHTIRKITPAGVVTTLAGKAGRSGKTDGAGTVARFNVPFGVAVDSAGNVYVADSNNSTIRKVTSAGGVTTLAGSAGVNGSADGTGSAAQFYSPSGVAVDAAGNVYVSDTYNNAIREVTPAGVVTTVAGAADTYGTEDGTGGDARFNIPWGVAVDGAGNLYVADNNNSTIREITPAGVVTTLAGAAGIFGSADGTGVAAQFNYPSGPAVDSAGNVYVADTANHTIREITPAGVVTTLAGVSTTGSADGAGNVARFNNPGSVALDNAGNLYVADTYNHTIREVSPAGVVTTLAGLAGVSGSADGTGSEARFYYPGGVTVDSAGNLYIADTANNTIRKMTPAGVVTTLAGTAGPSGSADGTGAAAQFNNPTGVAVDSGGNLYVADEFNFTIRKVTAAGDVTTLAGTAGTEGYTNGTGGAAAFSYPNGVAVDGAGNVYVTDSGNNAIRKVTAAGVVTTLARPVVSLYGLAVDSAGNVFVAGGDFNEIRKVTPTGVVAVVAGNSSLPGSADGLGSLVRFNYPEGVAVDAAGNLYVADTFNNTIRKGIPPVLYTVSPAAGLNGSINPNTPKTVLSSSNITFQATPDNNFVVDQWTVNGTSIQAGGTSFTVTNVTADKAVLVTFRSVANYSGPYTFTTLAGVGLLVGPDGTGSGARFHRPRGVAADSAGNLYVVDGLDSVVRKVTPAGEVTTLAGRLGYTGYANGTGTNAYFNQPNGVAVDAAGNVYVADTASDTIRKVTPAGVVTTLAGSGGQIGSADGTGSTARFHFPNSLAVDNTGNIYVTDTQNFTIRKITPAGVVTTLAGLAGVIGSADGTGSDAQFYYPAGVAVDGAGNVYVADFSNQMIRKVTPAGVVTTLAGLAGSIGTVDGTGSDARFNNPTGVAVDSAGKVFVTDQSDQTIRQITPDGVVTTLAGLAGQPGSTNGLGSDARFNSPYGLAADTSGNLYVADAGNALLRKVTPAGAVTTLAGAISAGSVDGTGSGALFDNPQGVAVDGAGNVYVADTYSELIRKITPAGVVTSLAGQSGNTGGTSDGTGSDARFYNPNGVAVDGAGNVFVADNSANTIREVTPAGVVTTVAATPYNPGSADGTGSAAQFRGLSGVAVDGAENVYVADTGNHTIRKMTPDGAVTTLAGLAGVAGSADGTGTNAQFSSPRGVAVDSAGTLYVADTGNYTIRKVTADGVVTTLAGLAGTPGAQDGTGNGARFISPCGVAVDGTGNVVVADTGNHTIRMITPAGLVTTLGGLPGIAGAADGVSNVAQFYVPTSVAVDSAGNIYVADSRNNTVRKGSPPLTVTPGAGPNGSINPATPQIVLSGASLTFSATPVGVYIVDQWLVNGIAAQTGSNSFTLAGIISNATVQVTFKLNHPPTANDLFVATPTDQLLSLALTNLLLHVSDADGDPVMVTGVSSASTNGAAVALTADAVTYTPTGGFNGADRFTYTVTDATGASTDGQVVVQVRPASVIAGQMLAPTPVSGGFTISFMGVPDGTYTLERATSLLGPWTTIGSITADDTGFGSFTETSAPSGTAFYRTTYP